MKKLDRYIVREMVVPFLIGTFVVVLMFQINTYIGLATELNLDSVPFSAVLQFIVYKTPEFLNLTLPAGMSLAAALAITRLARESELTAMRAAGVRILRVVLPIAIFGTFVAVGNFYLVEKVIPRTTREANRIGMQAAILGMGSTTFAANKMISLKRYTASFGSVSRRGDDLDIRDVLLVERPGPEGQIYLTTAQSATYHNGIWSFHGAYWRWLNGEDLWQAKPMKDFTVNEPIVVDEMFMPPSPQEQSTEQLRQAIRTAKMLKTDYKQLEVEYYVKYSIPAACIVFAIVAPVFAIYFARTGGFVGVLVSFVIVLLYYNAFVISTKILGKIDSIPAWLAAWSPNIVFALLGIAAIRRLE